METTSENTRGAAIVELAAMAGLLLSAILLFEQIAPRAWLAIEQLGFVMRDGMSCVASAGPLC